MTYYVTFIIRVINDYSFLVGLFVYILDRRLAQVISQKCCRCPREVMNIGHDAKISKHQLDFSL